MAALVLLAGERQKGESRQAVLACNDFLNMGPGRSLRKLYSKYNELEQSRTATQAFGTLAHWSTTFNRQKRAERYDAAIEAEKNVRTAEKRREVMEEGVALDFERVRHLKEVEADLRDQYFAVDEHGKRFNLWVHDVKQIGSGENAERVDIERFNAALIEQWRGVNSDIAAEKGERKLRFESASLAVTLSAEHLEEARYWPGRLATREELARRLDTWAISS